ncbi:hypothetical protein CcaverHIS002_0207220 [Cutaneotrichosporon cavernicola]|nr:hypothetical protein CcaverHIS002_0207220 [Cutaneotrichosporon cavernicola]
MVYNGDEVSAVVVDFGSHTTRGGFAGEDGPRVVTPSFYGYMNVEEDAPPATNGDGNGNGGDDDPMDGSTEKKEKKGKRKFFFGDDGVSVWRKDMEIGSFMVDGIVNDAEAAGQMLSYVLRSRMGVDPTEHPLMLTEPAWSTPASRETLAQLAFEGEGVPAMYFGSSGVLSAFAAGKPTALVLDVGYANSSAVPVVEGYALRAGTMRQPLASSLVLAQLHHHFQTPTPTRAFPLSLLPRQLIARRDTSVDPGTQPHPGLREDRGEDTTASWRAWAEQGVVENWKEACSELVSARGFDIRTATNLPQVLYEFPDGYQQYFGEERYRFTEMLYDPKNYFDQSYEPPALLRATPSSDHSHSLKDAVSLSQLVHDSIMACDVDVRAALLQNIVVVGNTSLTRGLTERLDVELATLMPSQKIKIHSPSIPYERKYSAWLGGSVLASLGTFHQLWVTKDEYEEHGMNIVHQRCNPISITSMSAPSSRATTPSPDSPSPSSSSVSLADISASDAPPTTAPSLPTTAPSLPTTAPSLPTTPSRARAVPIYSPLAATANTPPRPPENPRCVADYTSTSESGSSFSGTDLSLSSPSSPLDALGARSPRQSQPSPIASTQSQPSPIPSTRVLPPAPPAPEDATARRAHILATAINARKAARAAAAISPSKGADEITEAIAGLDLNAGAASKTVAVDGEDVFTDSGPAETDAPNTKTGSRSRSVNPLNLPYFSLSRPLAGHFDRPPNVVYTRDASEADDLIACLRGPLGFDLEWPPPGIGPVLRRQNQDGSIKHYRAGKWDPLANKYVWPQGRTAVVQVADSRTVVVYHIPIDGVFGPGLKAVLNDPTRLKLGVNISMDARKLHRDELIENTSSLLELSHVARLVDPDAWTRSGRLISLARLTQHYLGVPLDKNEGIREGAWSQDLNSVQIEYAANDAYVGVLIYNAMVRRAEERGITADLAMLKMQVAIPQFSAPAVKLAESTRRHPAVVAATRAGAKPRQSLALSLFVAGGSVSDLATALHISTRTVQGYVAQAAQLIPADEYEGYGELAVRLCEAFPIDSYPAVRNVEFFRKLRGIASARDKADRVPVHDVQEHEWGPDY